MNLPTVRKITPVMLVDRIEPVLPFWLALGAEPSVQVPDTEAQDGRLGFVILTLQGTEIMYQTVASVRADLVRSSTRPSLFQLAAPQAILFVEVTNLDEIESRLEVSALMMPRRTTFYGSNEVGYVDPAGNVVIFAQQGVQDDTAA